MRTETTSFVTADRSRLVVPFHEALARLVPHAREITWNGGRMLVLPNRAEETRLARNLGISLPPPILTTYDWRNTIPWQIQKSTAALLVESTRCYVLSDLGTGKTRSVIYALDHLMHQGQVRRALVVAPLSTLTPVWEREFFQLMLHEGVRVLHGSKEKRIKLLDEGSPICVINHHGLMVMKNELLKAGFDAIVIDELAVFRNKRTELWKAANALIQAQTTKYAWGLTGSPTPNAPTDAWAQVQLLTPWRASKSFLFFRDQVMQKVSTFRWVPKPGAISTVRQMMAPSVRFTRDDVMELPDCITVDREAKLEGDAARAYKMLFDKARLITAKGDTITAVNEGVLQSKLLQASCGYLYTDEKTVYALPMKPRLDALDEVLGETERKILVLVPFLHALHGVADYLTNKKHDLAVVHGGTSRTLRDKIFTGFQTKPSPRIIVAHPQCLAHGLTLTEANTIVWYSPTTSLEIYEQANARINRPGQTHKMLIVHLVGTQVERATYARLRQKSRMQGCLLELFRQQVLPF